jgi:hypothetical protein
MTSIPLNQIEHYTADHSRRRLAPSGEAFPFRFAAQMHRRVGYDRVIPIRNLRQHELGIFWPCDSAPHHRLDHGGRDDCA